MLFGLLDNRSSVKKENSKLNDKNYVNNPVFASEKTTILLGGDVMLGRGVNKKAIDIGDFSFPLKGVSDLFVASDTVLVNLESPLVEGCPISNEGYIFCADPRMVDTLVAGYVDIVNLSNNHIRNFGQKGIVDTKNILSSKDISHVGLGDFATKELNGIVFGFLGFDYTFSDITEKDIDLIKSSKERCDVLIVTVHWGEEYKAIHNSKQERIAKIMVKNGADIIAGHHPHWVQDTQVIDGKPVFYSLGNLVFDQMWSEQTKKGMLVKLNFEKGKLVDYEEFPVYIHKVGEPVLVEN